MGGCPNGAVAAPGLHGTWQLGTIAGLTQTLRNILKLHAPTSYAAFTDTLFFVDSLCSLNPDPPPPLTADDWVDNLAYTVVGGGGLGPKIVDWIFQWVRYETFLRVCVCNPFTLDPAKNCLHATNIVIPSGQNNFISLATVTIEDQVYDSWIPDSTGNVQFFVNWGKVSNQTQSQAVNWFVQFQGSDGVWVDMLRGDGPPEGSFADANFTIQNGRVRLPRIVPMRIRTNFGAAGTVSRLDICFKPAPVAPQPLPPEPTDPNIPVPTPPVCSTDDLCAIVQELARQLTRVAGQISDVQARVGGTDVFDRISSVAISGEGQVDVPLGTRAVCVVLSVLGPSVYTSALGRPRGLMRAGSLRWGTGTGYTPRVFIDAETWTVARPQGGLNVSYQLLAGTSGELVFLR